MVIYRAPVCSRYDEGSDGGLESQGDSCRLGDDDLKLAIDSVSLVGVGPSALLQTTISGEGET